jgi:CDP-diacylglycerol pyrophosphatase
VGARTAIAIAALWVATPFTASAAAQIDPTILWRIVHEKCAPVQAEEGRPGACQLVDLDGRYAVLKDLHGDTRFLLLPTDPVTGIESPALLQPDVPHYWQAAWTARRYVEEKAGRPIPREAIGLSINSVFRRSQNQLHIHIDCVSPQLQKALQTHAREISEQWSAKPMELAERSYYVMKITGSDVGTDPFHRLAQRLTHPETQMGGQSLSLVGAQLADGKPGFYLLDSPAGIRGATSEDVLDRSCSLLRATQSKSP